MSEYIGNRIVPRHDGVWDKAKEYEPLTIVYEESTGDSYMSRKPVPAGTLLSQEEYWAMCSRFSEQMALYRQNTADDVAQLRSDTAADVATLRKMTAQDVADITQKVDAANSAVAANKSEMDKTAETLKAQIDANVKASTDKNANYAQELVDARVDDAGKTYSTAGDNIRSIGRVRSMQNIMKNWVINNGYANQNGNLVASESWRVAHMVPVSGDSILVDGQFGYMSSRDDYNNVVCYDMDRKLLGGCFRAESGKVYDNYVITLLPNTRFISVTTSEKLFSKLSVYLYDNMLPLRLLSNYATGWQWMNGSVEIKYSGSKVTVTFPEGKDVYICRRPNGIQYEQTKLGAANSISVEFSTKGWWAVYYDGMEVSADEAGEKIEVPVIKVENTSGSWGNLFTRNRFVFAVLYDGNVVIKRLHERSQFLLNVTRQEAHLLVLEGDYRPCHQDLLVVVCLCQGSGHGQKGFSGSGCSGEGYQFNVLVHYGIHGEDLLFIPWRYSVLGQREYPYDLSCAGVKTAEDDVVAYRVAVFPTHVQVFVFAFVGVYVYMPGRNPVKLVEGWFCLDVQVFVVYTFAVHQSVDGFLRNVCQLDYTVIILGEFLFLDMVVEVILSKHSQSLCLEPEVHVLCYKAYGTVWVLVLVPDSRCKNPVVWNIACKAVCQIFREWVVD